MSHELHLQEGLVQTHGHGGVHFLADHRRAITVHFDTGDAVNIGAVDGLTVFGEWQLGGGRLQGLRCALPAMDPLAVGCLPQLGHQFVEGDVERRHLIFGGGLSPDHRSLVAEADLYSAGLIVLSLVSFRRDFDVDPNDPAVELLESSDLLLDVGAKRLRHRAVPALDDNIHVSLQLVCEPPTAVPLRCDPRRVEAEEKSLPTSPFEHGSNLVQERHIPTLVPSCPYFHAGSDLCQASTIKIGNLTGLAESPPPLPRRGRGVPLLARLEPPQSDCCQWSPRRRLRSGADNVPRW